MPEGVDKFIDLFTGGCNVGVNVEAEKLYVTIRHLR